MENSKQHVQLPSDKESTKIQPRDQLIYLAIKKFQNKDTKEAFPSLQKIAEVSGASVPTVSTSIKILIEEGYISRKKVGKKYIYSFNPYKTFEPFSNDFLDIPKEELSFTEKSYLVASQKYMYKENGTGSLSYSAKEMSKLINMPERTIYDCIKHLKIKDYIIEITNTNKDLESRCKTKTYVFDLLKLHQEIVFTLYNHEERISNNEKTIAQLAKTNDLLIRKVEELEAKLKERKTITVD